MSFPFSRPREGPFAVQPLGLDRAFDAVVQMQAQTSTPSHVEGGNADLVEALHDHGEHVRPAQCVGMGHGGKGRVDHLEGEVQQMEYKEESR